MTCSETPQAAGGSLLGELYGAVESALDCYVKCGGGRRRGGECRRCARALGVDPNRYDGVELLKALMRGAGLQVVTSGSWRRKLPNALKLADLILGDIAKGYEEYYGYVVDFKAVLLDYGLVGTGSGLFQAFFEVGLQLDSILGLPYYPASTIKGAVRTAAEELLGEEAATALFGASTAEEGGWVGLFTFAPSYPVGCINGPHPCLIMTGDVVTPHYFKPGRGVVDSEMEAEPTPIVHAAIAPGTVFRFVVGVREPPRAIQEKVMAALDKARSIRLLDENAGQGIAALAQLAANLTASALLSGIAARSAKGYNVLKPLESEEGLSHSVLSIRIRRGGGSG